jgi:nucleoside-diphosphate-sugar epimerase
MRVVVIGGTGHIGTYLIPRLVEGGHEVISISRGQRKPYHSQKVWKLVQSVEMDRQQEENKGTFGSRILELKPDVVIDLICFTLESATSLVMVLQGNIHQFLHCGTIWVHGPGIEVPITENKPRKPISEYGKNKAAIESYLLNETVLHGFPATILHPGHIVGKGWKPLNPAGNFNMEVFTKLARGEELALPNFGLETVHHVHADDVAQAFIQAIHHRNQAVGESFHVVSPRALILRGYAESVAGWFGQSAKLRFLPWEDWKNNNSKDDAQCTLNHINHCSNCSIEKAKQSLHYHPRYTSLQAIQESVDWLVEQKMIQI